MTRKEQPGSKRGRCVIPFYPPPPAGTANPYTIRVYAAAWEPARWQAFNEMARCSYASRGLENLSDDHPIDIDRYPTYFAQATVRDGAEERSVGGIRIHGADADGQLLLFEELEGYTDVDYLRRYVDELRPGDVCHGGGLWIDPEHSQSVLAADLARACVPIVTALKVGWCVAMTHTRILEAWDSLGWRAIGSMPSFPYPDERYLSSVILGGPESWPAPVAAWAADQARDVGLDGPGGCLTVRPLRCAPRLRSDARMAMFRTPPAARPVESGRSEARV